MDSASAMDSLQVYVTPDLATAGNAMGAEAKNPNRLGLVMFTAPLPAQASRSSSAPGPRFLPARHAGGRRSPAERRIAYREPGSQPAASSGPTPGRRGGPANSPTGRDRSRP